MNEDEEEAEAASAEAAWELKEIEMRKHHIYLVCLIVIVIAAIVIFAFFRQPSLNDDNGSRTLTDSITVLKSVSGHIIEENAKKGKAAYSYEMKEASRTEAEVSLEFDVRIDRKIYSGTANGSVLANEFSTGKKLWEGPLEGTLRMDDAVYEILVGFSKQDQMQEIRCSVTIMGLLEGTDKKGLPFTGFTFGESVVTQDMLDEMLS